MTQLVLSKHDFGHLDASLMAALYMTEGKRLANELRIPCHGLPCCSTLMQQLIIAHQSV